MPDVSLSGFVQLVDAIKPLVTAPPPPPPRPVDAEVTHLAEFVLERTLQEYRLLAHAPSALAAGALALARRTLRPSAAGGAWPPALAAAAGLAAGALVGVVADLEAVLGGDDGPLNAVHHKYSQPGWGQAAAAHRPQLAQARGAAPLAAEEGPQPPRPRHDQLRRAFEAEGLRAEEAARAAAGDALRRLEGRRNRRVWGRT